MFRGFKAVADLTSALKAALMNVGIAANTNVSIKASVCDLIACCTFFYGCHVCMTSRLPLQDLDAAYMFPPLATVKAEAATGWRGGVNLTALHMLEQRARCSLYLAAVHRVVVA
jgi:hypothetical protein